ncbi:hypothetical protein MKZ38_001765 [Zalerion maritima]|uniref:C2H2-type domain-containing protein n=1 Tax=Zalerion maritima TaxID=339359 RepID=A0AAD5WXY9_9PEZI|nr:hypothetical protein MKZ38_001765 [Zalerion maritima]
MTTRVSKAHGNKQQKAMHPRTQLNITHQLHIFLFQAKPAVQISICVDAPTREYETAPEDRKSPKIFSNPSQPLEICSLPPHDCDVDAMRFENIDLQQGHTDLWGGPIFCYSLLDSEHISLQDVPGLSCSLCAGQLLETDFSSPNLCTRRFPGSGYHYEAEGNPCETRSGEDSSLSVPPLVAPPRDGSQAGSSSDPNPSRSPNGDTTSMWKTTLSHRPQHNISRQKRAIHDIESDSPNSVQSEDGDGRARKNPKWHGGAEEREPTRGFACIFYRHHPGRYSRCRRYSMQRARDVKQHLLRHHCRPHYCPRCGDIFEEEGSKDRHIRDAKCERHDVAQHDGITADQRKALSTRRAPANEREYWFMLWDITFPGKDRPDPALVFVGGAYEESMFIMRFLWKNRGRELLSKVEPEVRKKYGIMRQDVWESNWEIMTETIEALLETFGKPDPRWGTERDRAGVDAGLLAGKETSPAPTVPFSCSGSQFPGNFSFDCPTFVAGDAPAYARDPAGLFYSPHPLPDGWTGNDLPNFTC